MALSQDRTFISYRSVSAAARRSPATAVKLLLIRSMPLVSAIDEASNSLKSPAIASARCSPVNVEAFSIAPSISSRLDSSISQLASDPRERGLEPSSSS